MRPHRKGSGRVAERVLRWQSKAAEMGAVKPLRDNYSRLTDAVTA